MSAHDRLQRLTRALGAYEASRAMVRPGRDGYPEREDAEAEREKAAAEVLAAVARALGLA